MFRPACLILLSRHAAAAVTLLALAGSAQAQYGSSSARSMFGPNPGIALTGMHGYSERIREEVRRKAAVAAQSAGRAQSAAPVASAAPPPPRHALSVTDFTPAGPRKVAEEIASKVRDPLERAKVVHVCKEIVSTIEASPGFRKNNLASAMTVLLGVSQQVLNGEELTDEQSQKLMRLINDDIVDSGAVAGWNNAQRTRAYDSMVITGGLIAGMAHNGAESGDKELSEQARRMARESLANLKVKP